MHFSGNQLEPDEEVVAALQDHWITMAISIFVYIISWSLFLLIFSAAILIKTLSFTLGIVLLFSAFAILFAAHHLFFLYFIEYLVSSVIVTNKRIIEIKFFPFFLDDVAYIELQEIHEIDKKKHGILKNILNYGDVFLNLAGKRETITFKYIRYPSKFINLIDGLKNQKPINELDIKNMGASCPKKYAYLLK